MRKRILALLLAVSMIAALSACGGNATQSEVTSKDGVFKVTDYEQDFGAEADDYVGMSQMLVVDDTIYALVDISFSNGSRTKYIAMDLDGKILKEHVVIENIWDRTDASKEAVAEVTLEETVEQTEDTYVSNSYISTYKILNDGRLAYVKTIDISDYANDEYINTNEFVVIDVDGTEHLRVTLSGMPEDITYFYANCVIPVGEDKVYLLASENAFLVDMEAEEAIYYVPETTVQSVYNVAFYKDGKPVAPIWDEEYTKQTYSVIDLETGAIEEELDIPASFSNFTIMEGGNSGYELLLVSNNAIYGYNMGDADKTLIMNYLNSDLATYRLRNISFMDEEHFIAMYNDIVDYESHFAKFEKVAPKDVPDKEILTIAATSIENTLKKEVIDFNKSSDKYRVVIEDYSEYNSQEDYTAGRKQLDMDLLAGKVPDILMCGTDFSLAKYMDMDLFTDFYELLAQDNELKKEDFCENVFTAYEVDGKLYQFPTSFHIMTVFGKSSIFGNDASITWDELNAVLEQYPEAKAFSDVTQNDMLTYGLYFMYGQLVDEVTGECNFESDEFKNFLTFVKQYPKEINWEEMYNDEIFWMDMESQYTADRTLLMVSNIYSAYDGWMQGFRTFGEKATPVGFPTNEGVGSAVESPASFAIYKDSKNVEGAWEFVKRFVREEAQMPEENSPLYSKTGRLPILKKALEECAMGITKKPSYIGVDGNRVEYDEYVYINNEQVLVEPGTEEDVKLWLDYILSIDKKTANNFEDALAIITEDADGYLNGDKSLDEVVGIIQSRMNILVNEDR